MLVALTENHARLSAGIHVCPECLYFLAASAILGEDTEDQYIRALLTAFVTDSYRHIAPSTAKSYGQALMRLRRFAVSLRAVLAASLGAHRKAQHARVCFCRRPLL